MAAAAALVSSASAWGQAPAWVEPAATTFRAAPDAPGLRGAAVANRAAAAATRVGAVAAALRQRGVAPGTADSLVELTGGGAGNGANGFTHVRLQQHLGGIPIHGSSVRSTFDARGELVHQIERVVPVEGVVPRPASVDESVALAAAMARVLPGVSVNFSRGARQGLRQKFAGGSFFHQDPEVSRVLVPMADGSLAHGYLVETWTQRGNQLRHTLVSGDGQVLQVQNRTASDSYNVFAIDPGKGPQTVTSGPGTSGTWSPAGWLNSGSQTTNRIVGNNADVYLDTNDNNGPDKGGSSVTTGNFTTAADLTQTPTTTANKAVSVQNMFFHINRIHDVLYSYGFNEAAGNFQSNNFGKGGVGGDPVNGEAQDGGGMDNANFSAPNDGSRGRMQMYLQHGAGPTHEVVVGGSAYGAKGAEFGTQLSTTGIADNLVAALDGSGTSTDACQALTNAAAVSGKFALVDRGSCDFTVKFQNVSNAGAVGMIVINNASTEPFTMTGSSSINKPAVMVSQADGATLRGLIGSVATMRKKAVQPLMRDGGLDADLIYHEYGHGLTWRMVGNMSGPFGGAIGEGAGDVLAFLMNGDDRFVEWASSAPNGWRRYPYGSHPLTYGAVQGLEVHNDGEIYAAAMWRLRELWLNSGRSNATLFAAWVNGMNYAVSAPRHEDMRDALLYSIAFTGGADATARCTLVWQAFAQRGIGDGARGTLNADNSVTVQESFATRSNCTH